MTEPFGPIQRGLVSRQFNNVLDLDASRKVKEATGKAVAIRKAMTPEDRKSTRLNSSHVSESRMPSSA